MNNQSELPLGENQNDTPATNTAVETIPAGTMQESNQPHAVTPSERFTKAVIGEFATNGGELQLTNFQRKLIQNYFLKIDSILKIAETKRLATKQEYRDALEFTWNNVNIPKLAVDVITFSSVELDPMQPNHLNPIPYKNSKTNKYDITFIIGFKGLELKAKKYGLDVPDNVVVELVYKTDHFKALKKDVNNSTEKYEFVIQNEFERGEIIGGFYYHEFNNDPSKNKIKIFSLADIEKRKPTKASAEFWGGEKDVYKWDQAQGKNVVVGKEKVEGWFDEMAEKTIRRAAYNAITIDSQKIDQNYLAVVEKEKESYDLSIKQLMEQNANSNANGIGFEEETHQIDGPIAPNLKATPEADKVQSNSQQQSGPNF